MTTSRKLRTMLARVMLIGISLFVGLLLAEGLTRILFPQLAPRTARLTKFWKYDSRYGWAHNPGASGYFETFGVQAFVTINSKGFRGPEIEHARDQKRQRVLVLGDSYVWGYGVKDDEVFTERLRAAMPEVEIVNMGVSGYGTDQELLLYRDEGYKYQADLVIIIVTENDPIGNLLTQQYVVYGKPAFQLQDGDKDGELTLVNQPVPRTPWWKHTLTNLATQSYVLTAANRHLYSKAIEGSAASVAQKKDGDGGSAATPTGLRQFPRTPEEKITARLLVELRREISARQGEGKLLVVFTEEMTGSQEMAQYLTPFGISCLDLEEHIDHKDEALHLPDDFHWNAEGHKRVAEILATHLGKRLE